ncbi:MAG TPA: phosphotransferase family protein [Blastocatellia bacterium]|nr:phosphotransferase family protein [Blastocatellia bacterium]
MSGYLDSTKPVRPGEELDAPRLESWIRERLPDFTGSLAVEQFPGGHSNLTYLLRIGEQEMVLRRPPFGNRVKSAHDMGREYRVLSKLCHVYGPAPRPLAYCEDESVIGAPFYLMERRRGLVIRNTPPAGVSLDPQNIRRVCEAVVDNLADLHGIDYQAAGLGDLGHPEGYATRQVEGWTKRYFNAKTEEHPEIEQIIPWLAERIPKGSGAAVVHNDYKFDNLMFDPADLTRIVAVLDWEMCTIGDPLMDLGCTLAYWPEAGDENVLLPGGFSPTALPGAMTRGEIAARYGEKTGRDVSHLLFYYCFGLFKLAAVLQQIYWRYANGHTQDKRFAHFNQSVAILGRAAVQAAEAGHF